MSEFYNEGVRFLISEIIQLKYKALENDEGLVVCGYEIVKLLDRWDKFREGKE